MGLEVADRGLHRGALAADGAVVAGLEVEALAEVGRDGPVARRQGDAVELHGLGAVLEFGVGGEGGKLRWAGEIM